MIEAYTDGAYSPTRNQGGWAFIFLKNGEKLFCDYGAIKETTNNRMEQQGVIEAIKYAKENNIKEITIYSDSMYVIATLTQNWKKKTNLDLWIQLDDLTQTDISIEWKHIKGHSGNKWNDYCDMLASHASQMILN